MGLKFNIIYSVCWSLTSPSTYCTTTTITIIITLTVIITTTTTTTTTTTKPLVCTLLSEARRKNREHRRSQSNSTYMSFQAQSLIHNISILATSASSKVLKIICSVCASIIIMVIGLILVRKRKVWIERYHRRYSKFVL
jgi:hypothetical protein